MGEAGFEPERLVRRGPFRGLNGPFRAEVKWEHLYPGLRPGLTETAFQAENAETP